LGTGFYCLTPASDIDVSHSPAVVSVDWASISAPSGNASAMAALPTRDSVTCPGPNKIVVITERQTVSGGVLSSARANDVGFTVIVP
jgi:hypothetical protein